MAINAMMDPKFFIVNECKGVSVKLVGTNEWSNKCLEHSYTNISIPKSYARV